MEFVWNNPSDGHEGGWVRSWNSFKMLPKTFNTVTVPTLKCMLFIHEFVYFLNCDPRNSSVPYCRRWKNLLHNIQHLVSGTAVATACGAYFFQIFFYGPPLIKIWIPDSTLHIQFPVLGLLRLQVVWLPAEFFDCPAMWRGWGKERNVFAPLCNSKWTHILACSDVVTQIWPFSLTWSFWRADNDMKISLLVLALSCSLCNALGGCERGHEYDPFNKKCVPVTCDGLPCGTISLSLIHHHGSSVLSRRYTAYRLYGLSMKSLQPEIGLITPNTATSTWEQMMTSVFPNLRHALWHPVCSTDAVIRTNHTSAFWDLLFSHFGWRDLFIRFPLMYVESVQSSSPPIETLQRKDRHN